MRIALVNQPFDAVLPPRLNSLGLWTFEVARRLAASHEVHVFAGAAGSRGSELEREGVHYHFLATPSRGRGRGLRTPGGPRRPFFASRLYYPEFGWQLGRRLARQRFDVVHVLNFSQFLGPARRACPEALLALHMECDWLVQLDAGLLAKRLGRIDLVIGCSDHVTRAARERFPGLPVRFQTVYNGVDAKAFGPPPLPPAGAPRLLYVGRGSPEKGTHILVDAVGKLLARHPGLELRMIGGLGAVPREFVLDLSDDPALRGAQALFGPQYRTLLEGKIAALGAGRVRVQGPTPHQELVRRYQESHVFVFPSLWDEPFGIPVLEAMACGIPVVATRSGGIPEIVVDGESGLLVERGDEDGLRAALARLLESPELRAQLGRAGRQRAEERFTWDRIAADLVGAYAGN